MGLEPNGSPYIVEYYIHIPKRLKYGYKFIYPKFLKGGQESPLGAMCHKRHMHIYNREI
jgi:hypothetical protein